jgi:hypothetical protein
LPVTYPETTIPEGYSMLLKIPAPGVLALAMSGGLGSLALRGIKDTPPYLHDGRLPTLDDPVEFFNLVLGLRLKAQEKSDLVAFLRAL